MAVVRLVTMDVRVALVAALLSSVVLAGCLTDELQTPNGGETPAAADDDFMPRVVVAIIDTGLQPYHHEFRQVREGEDPYAHPSTYLEGYPADAEDLPITLELESYPDPEEQSARDAHMEHDEELWQNATRDTMYWLPGTKVVGFIGIGADLPGGGHGSMTSGRSTGNTISIPGDEVLLVNIRAPLSLELDADGDSNEGRATRWAADQPWIDIQSHSWGNFVQCGDVAYNQASGWSESFKYARDKQLVFVAAANGYGNSGTLGYPSHCQSNAGVAGVVTVSATDNQGYSRWSNWFPAIAADGCQNPAVKEDTLDENQNTGGGTSSATPYSAGGMAKVILEARRILRDPGVGIHDGIVAEAHEGAVIPSTGPLADGIFTMDEAKQVLFHTAQSPPRADPSDGNACLANIPAQEDDEPTVWYPFIGYGEINVHTVDHAIQVLLGATPEPERPTEDDLYEQDQDARREFWG